MSAWTAPAPQPAIDLPTGVAVADMGRRIGAWITDRVVAGLLFVIPIVVALASGALSFNQQALDQLERSTSYRPFDDVTAPLFNVNTGPLWSAGALWILLSMLYYVVPWVAFGSTLGQRVLGLKVMDLRTGHKLGLPAAVVRWATLDGVVIVVGVFGTIESLVQMGRTPANEMFGYSAGMTATYRLSTVSWLASLATSAWLLVLLATAYRHFAKRGLHDRIVGSIVVGPVHDSDYAPGWAPQGWPSAPQGWPSAPQDWAPAQQGWAPAQQGWPPAQQGWPSAPQGWPPAPQGWAPAQQGWPPAPQGWAPPSPGSPEPQSPPAQDQAPDQR